MSRPCRRFKETRGEKRASSSKDFMFFLFVLVDELVHEKEKYKAISEELDQTFQELSGY